MNKRQIKRRAKKLASLNLKPDALERYATGLLYEAIQDTLDVCMLIVRLLEPNKKNMEYLHDLFKSAAINPDLLYKERDKLCDLLAEVVDKEMEEATALKSDLEM